MARENKKQIPATSRVGEKFGMLTILDVYYKITGNKRARTAFCSTKCDCGVVTEKRLSALISNTTTSCGCKQNSKKITNYETLIGVTINNLKLIQVDDFDTQSRIRTGLLECGLCGAKKTKRLKEWKRGVYKSCGCKKNKKRTRSNPTDVVGQTFHHLTIEGVYQSEIKKRSMAKVKCQCGTNKEIVLSNILSGNIQSCGCSTNSSDYVVGKKIGFLKLLSKRDSKTGKARFLCLKCNNETVEDYTTAVRGIKNTCGCDVYHGLTSHKSYAVYHSMIRRCTNPLHQSYPQYGGRGVKVCDRWMEPNGKGLKNFMEDIGNARPDKKHSLHRMWKYEGERLVEMMEYGPDTCKWATSRQQNVEKRSPSLKKKVSEVEKYLIEGLTVDQIAKKMNKSPQKIAFFLSTMGLLEGYKYQEEPSL